MSKVGQNIWLYDANSRTYNRDENGKAYGQPIYKKSWVKHTIVNETTQSYILDGSRLKIPKNKEKQFNVCFSEQEVDEACYVHDNSYKMSELVRQANYKQLKAIADILGYKEIK